MNLPFILMQPSPPPCITVQEKLDSLTAGNNSVVSERAAPSGGGGGISGVGGRLFNIDGGDNIGTVAELTKNLRFGSTSTPGGGGGASGGSVAMAMGSSTPNMSTTPSTMGASSKVKASHKLKAQTSRIVSSFKQQSVVCSVVREYNGHKVSGTTWNLWIVVTKNTHFRTVCGQWLRRMDNRLLAQRQLIERHASSALNPGVVYCSTRATTVL